MLLFSHRFILFFFMGAFFGVTQAVTLTLDTNLLPPPEKPEPYQSKKAIFLILSLQKNAKGFQREKNRFLPIVASKPYLPTIILDAGHGGKDPGSISRSGLHEKDITLKAAVFLYKELRKTLRYNVVLTRQKDVFVPKRERFAIARNAKADFLISIHADNHPSMHVRGLTIYTLSAKASDTEALRLSEQENKRDYFGFSMENVAQKEADGLFDVFVDIAQRGSSNTALILAKGFHIILKKSAIGKVMSLRSADLAVLKAPEVPSILVELGYLSNAKDEKLIQTLKYKKAIARSLIQALDTYFKKS